MRLDSPKVLYCRRVPLVGVVNKRMDLFTTLPEADFKRSTIYPGLGVAQEAALDKLLDVIGAIRARVIIPRPQLGVGQLLIGIVVRPFRAS